MIIKNETNLHELLIKYGVGSAESPIVMTPAGASIHYNAVELVWTKHGPGVRFLYNGNVIAGYSASDGNMQRGDVLTLNGISGSVDVTISID